MSARPYRHLVLPVAIIVAVVLADQWTKYVVEHRLRFNGPPVVVIPGFFHLVHVRNTGAAWGMLADSTMALSALSALVFGAMAVWFGRFTGGLLERAIALALIMGGIGGNLIDRLWRHGVVDFLSFFWRSFEWPAFNIADSAICVGVGVYLISSFWRGDTTTTADTPPGSGAAPRLDGA